MVNVAAVGNQCAAICGVVDDLSTFFVTLTPVAGVEDTFTGVSLSMTQ